MSANLVPNPGPADLPLPSAAPSRRVFLAGAAALAGACASAPDGSKDGQDGQKSVQARPVPKGPRHQALPKDAALKIGVIGCGGMGRGHVESLVKLGADKERPEPISVVALSDVSQPALAKARTLVEKGGGSAECYADYRQMLARGDLHGVVVASPEHWHGQMAEDAIASGVDVYVEKPMTIDLATALRLRAVVQANDAILQVGTQYMMWPRYQEARKLIQEGAIGRPVHSQTSYCRNSKAGEWLYEIDPTVQPGKTLDWNGWLGPAGDAPWDPQVFHRWRRYKRYSTGIIGDLLVHMMTPMLHALQVGWPVHVSATGSRLPEFKMENHDHVLLNVRFEQDHLMSVMGSTCNETGLEQMIRGHKANLLLGGNNCVLRPERTYADDVDEREIKCSGLDEQNELRRDWLACIRSRQPNRSPVELGTQVMVIVDLAARALWSGKSWTFDPATLTARAV